MSTISSTLIQACLTNVQKEFRQLEHWLNSLHPSEQSPPSSLSNDRMEATLRDISSSISQLAKQYEVQQLALHHIVDRLDILEGARDIQIEENDNPWLIDSTGTCLENTIIEPVEPVYVIHKEENEVDSHTPVMTKTPPTSPITTSASPVSSIELVEEAVQKVEPVKEVEAVAVVEPVKEVEPVKVQEVVEEAVEEEEEQEEEAQVEEEEGVELEEIIYKEQSYYKDGEGFIYGIDEEGQPTDQPIGVWKEKSQSVAFYRLK